MALGGSCYGPRKIITRARLRGQNTALQMTKYEANHQANYIKKS